VKSKAVNHITTSATTSYLPPDMEAVGSGGRVAEQNDFSRPRTFKLAEQRPDKTLDIGVNGISVTADPLGRVS
jgi:hypothetical protein